MPLSMQTDFAAIRRLFPITTRMTYLDSARHTPLSQPIKAAIERFLQESELAAGPKVVWLAQAERVRAQVARLLHTTADRIAFVKNTSEGLNLAAQSLPLEPNDEVLLVRGDHPNTAVALQHLRRKGVTVRLLSPASQPIDASVFAPHLNPRTRALALSHVMAHDGTRCDLSSLSELCAHNDLYLVLDAVQSVGWFPVACSYPRSALAFGCTKGLLCPPGLGVLCLGSNTDELKLPLAAANALAELPHDRIIAEEHLSFRHDASRFETGIANFLALHALEASLDIIDRVGVAAIATHVLRLGDLLRAAMSELGVEVVGPADREYRSHICTLALPGVDWVEYLAGYGIRVSPERGGVRVSFALFNSEDDVDHLAATIRRRLESRDTRCKPRIQSP
jgi:selenocysteine lyase/cysteine desulfurase